MTASKEVDNSLNPENKKKLDSFFEQTPEITVAFYKLMYEKIKSDGFFNLEPFINPGFNKTHFKDSLFNSRFRILHIENYPKSVDELSELWKKHITCKIKDEFQSDVLETSQCYKNIEKINEKSISKNLEDNNPSFFDTLHDYSETQGNCRLNSLIDSISENEAYAIVVWVFKPWTKIEDRVELVVDYLKAKLSDFFGMNLDFLVKDNYIIYNPKVVAIEIITSLDSLMKALNEYDGTKSLPPKLPYSLSSQKSNGKRLYFRGHSDANYKLLPSVYRNSQIEKNESKLYNLIKIESPKSFMDCKTHLDEIAIMQHYGISTRILDITSNILVALFFAAINDNTHGEFIVFDIPDSFVKFNRDPEVMLLASLSALDYQYKQDLLNSYITETSAHEAEDKLAYEIRLENPSWDSKISEKDLRKVIFVSPEKRTPRIIRQSGAFFLFGLYSTTKIKNPASDCKLKDDKGRTVVFIVKKSDKKKIIEQLRKFNINHATLFPEVENIARHIMDSYQSML